jgi:DNA-binding transcriptional LysR family regulator
MELNRLRYILTVAKHGNISSAAKELYISQPALTKAINKTEDELGIRLFDRNSTPIRLTDAGERYLDGARKIINIEETVNREMQAIANSQAGRITIGIPREHGSRWLPYILPPFLKSHPGVEIKIVEGDSNLFEREMIKGNIDFSLYTLPVYSDELDYEIICDDPILLVVPSQHPITALFDTSHNSPITPHLIYPELLEHQPFITLTESQGMYRTAMQIFERHGIKPNIIMKIKSNETAFRLVTAGLGMMFAPMPTCLYASPIQTPVYFTLENPIFCRKVIVAYRKGDCLSANAIKIIEIIRDLSKRSPELQLLKPEEILLK